MKHPIVRNNRGFTLTELLVVITIIGIITAIAVPNCLAYLARLRLKTCYREMAAIFQFARTQALCDDGAWRVSFDSAAGRYCLLDGSETVSQTVELDHQPGISFGSNNPAPIDANHVAPPPDGVTYVGNKVKFNTDGTATAGTVYLRNKNGDTIALGTASATGQIKTWYDFGSGWQPQAAIGGS
jgi:prepilin-type N-terminal cleavage/methylation domain-containing protein